MRGLYARLALDGIRKNRRLYIPYLASCVLMVTVYGLLTFLSKAPSVAEMGGGGNMQIILRLGSGVIMIFSTVVLFFTNSFLVRRRQKEFGLYNILGMTKRNITRILALETLFTYLISVVVGAALCMGLSRAAELGLAAMAGERSAGSGVGPSGLADCAAVFAVIFALLFLNSLRLLRGSGAMELLRSEQHGEKPPKANWALGLLGAVLLAAAYWLAIAIEEPLEALLFFFAAVVLVIIATYLLFIAGSVVLCRLLQRNKEYYYQPRHFVSVSSMAYRMKRSGAGLASICILLTMVLVMLCASACLYRGRDDSLTARFPRDICVSATRYGFSESDSAAAEGLRGMVESVTDPADIDRDSVVNYYEYAVDGTIRGSHVSINLNSLTDMAFIRYDELATVHFVSLSDYNRLHGKQEVLADDEVLLCAVKTDAPDEVFSVEDLSYRVVKRLNYEELKLDGASPVTVIGNVFLIVSDLDAAARYLERFRDYDGSPMTVLRWYYEFDSPAPHERHGALAETIAGGNSGPAFDESEDRVNLLVQSHYAKRSDFYGTYAGLFFIGLLLSVVFLTSAAMIIYYKQLSEGYEDQPRFAAMKSVGMTRRDIRQSIDSQLLLVFLLPLLAAVVHLGFAFPFVNKILMLFGVLNTALLARITGLAVLGCGVFYAAVYRVTSRVYFNIVDRDERRSA